MTGAVLLTARTDSRAQTVRVGRALGALLRPGDVVCLSGDLGAGKTAFASGAGLGWGAVEPVSSPTFVIAHEHHRRADAARLIHIDCYRLESADQADSIGLEDILDGSAAVLIEWPERIGPWLPADALWVRLELPEETSEGAEDARMLTLYSLGPAERWAGRIGDLAAALKEDAHAARD